MKVKSDHRSDFSNLSNWKEEAWKKKKNQGFNKILTRDLRYKGAMLYQLSYEATHWERGQFIEFNNNTNNNEIKQNSNTKVARKPKRNHGACRYWAPSEFLSSRAVKWCEVYMK